MSDQEEYKQGLAEYFGALQEWLKGLSDGEIWFYGACLLIAGFFFKKMVF